MVTITRSTVCRYMIRIFQCNPNILRPKILSDYCNHACLFSPQTIFLGYGPSFNFKTKVPAFENIELYNIMCGKINLFQQWTDGCDNLVHVYILYILDLLVLFAGVQCRTACISFCRCIVLKMLNTTWAGQDDVWMQGGVDIRPDSPLDSTDLLGVKPVPNNGTHGSLNHLLKLPAHKPAMPEEVSKPTPSGPVGGVTDDLGCSCEDKVSALSNPQNAFRCTDGFLLQEYYFFYRHTY